MEVVVLIMEIVLCLFSLFLIAVVLLQSGRSAGLTGDIAGGAETFLGKSKAKGYEGTLKKLTKVAAVGMMVLAIALVLIQVYVMGASNEEIDETPTATPAPTLINPSASVSASTAPSEEASVQATMEASAETAPVS